MSARPPVITFLSDYGLDDEFVGTCHAVIATICPAARVIDLTHGVPRHDVRAGAILLRDAMPYLPIGVHLAVVDPGVGAMRRAVAVRLADDQLLVGPDNGLLSLAAAAGGGVTEAFEISRSRFRLEPVSATFHGRDIFAPVAAHLAAGAPLAVAGEPCDPAGLVTLELSRPRAEKGSVVAHAVYIDRFGNIQLDVEHGDIADVGFQLGQAVRVEIAGGATHPARYVRTFTDVASGELLVYEDASRRLAIAVSHGDAAARLDVRADHELRVSAEPPS